MALHVYRREPHSPLTVAGREAGAVSHVLEGLAGVFSHKWNSGRLLRESVLKLSFEAEEGLGQIMGEGNFKQIGPYLLKCESMSILVLLRNLAVPGL